MRSIIRKTYMSVADNFKLAFRYSLMLTAAFAAIFILSRITGFYKITELRFINYVLFYPLGFAAVRKAYKLNNDYIEYFNGLMTGFLTGALGQLWYAILFWVYLHIDTAFLSYLLTQMPQPLVYPRLSVFFVMVSEGLGMSAILSLTLMQYFKWRQGRWAVSHG